MHHPIVHFVLALYLALWSPAICCCAIKRELAWLTGAAALPCGAEQCDSAAANVAAPENDACPHCAPRQTRSCCAAEEDTTPEPESSQPQRECRCHEQDRTLTRAESPVKVDVPVVVADLHLLWLSRTMEPASGLDLLGRADRVAIAHQRSWPPRTLLGLGCLLII